MFHSFFFFLWFHCWSPPIVSDTSKWKILYCLANSKRFHWPFVVIHDQPQPKKSYTIIFVITPLYHWGIDVPPTCSKCKELTKNISLIRLSGWVYQTNQWANLVLEHLHPQQLRPKTDEERYFLTVMKTGTKQRPQWEKTLSKMVCQER